MSYKEGPTIGPENHPKNCLQTAQMFFMLLNCLPGILSDVGPFRPAVPFMPAHRHELLYFVELLPPKVGEVLRLVGEQAREVDGQLLRLGEVEDVDNGVRRGYGCIGFDVISCGKYH